MTERIIIAGAGGQGVMLAAKVLANAAMKEGRFITWLPSYGAEVRGGTSHCMVTISDREIGSPYIEKADTLIIMNGPSLKRFKERISLRGLLILNSSLAPDYNRQGIKVVAHPFTDMAVGLGNIKVANMIALGFFIARKKIVMVDTVLKVFSEIAPQGKDKDSLIRINEKALRKGAGLR